MKINMGRFDRTIRAVAAVVLVVVGVLAGPASVLAIVLYVLAAIMVLTSSSGRCPAYSVVGVSTCRAKGSDSEG